MAYSSVANTPAFKGKASPWAKAFAGVAAEAWIHTMAKVTFFEQLALSGRPFVVVPKIGRSQIEAVALYAPKLTGNRLALLLHAEAFGNFEHIVREWRKLGRAFVHFCINPSQPHPLDVIDHNGTVRIVNELAQLDRPEMSSLREFDEALGCSLVEARKECERLLPLHGFAPLPKLADPYDNLSVIPR